MLRHVSEHMITDYGRLWISVHVGARACMRASASVCAAVRAHTCGPRMSPCMTAFKHAFAERAGCWWWWWWGV